MQCLTHLIFLLVGVESIFKTLQSALLYCYFGSLSSRIIQRSNYFRHLRLKIFEHLVARGYDFFQK